MRPRLRRGWRPQAPSQPQVALAAETRQVPLPFREAAVVLLALVLVHEPGEPNQRIRQGRGEGARLLVRS
jgi:hypothetical protein